MGLGHLSHIPNCLKGSMPVQGCTRVQKRPEGALVDYISWLSENLYTWQKRQKKGQQILKVECLKFKGVPNEHTDQMANRKTYWLKCTEHKL